MFKLWFARGGNSIGSSGETTTSRKRGGL
jgi:hypothetical protein